MFRKTDEQRSLFNADVMLSPRKVDRLRNTWAEQFRAHILPMIDEQAFAHFYHESNGRPNASVRLQVCLLLLKEMFDLTDAELLDQLEWNMLWHHALDLEADAAHLERKTLFNFRNKLLLHGGARGLFTALAQSLATLCGTSFEKQRIDSTHILSNVAHLSRLGLFVSTLELFMRQLKRHHPHALAALDRRFGERYLAEREGCFGDVTQSRVAGRMQQCAEDVFELVHRFAHDKTVGALEAYPLLVRLLDEQCDVGQGEALPRLKPAKEVAASSMQTPHDPDVTYGHKGKGYEAQVSETFGETSPVRLITDVAVTPSCGSDFGELVPALERLEQEGHRPDVLLADAGYISGQNLLDAHARGVELVGPTHSGQAKEELLHYSNFELAPLGSAHPVIRCPQGHAPVGQSVSRAKEGKVYNIYFERGVCEACPRRAQCPVMRHEEQAKEDGKPQRTKRRNPALRMPETSWATALMRQREQDKASFRELYRFRAAIEGVNSEAKRCHGLGKLRVRGARRVDLAVCLKATAINIKRTLHALVEGVLEPPAPLAA